MAKKKFNISSTLKKNAKKEKVELAAKVPLKKVTKDPEEIKEKVEEIHADEVIDKVEPIEEPVRNEPPVTKNTSRSSKAKKASPPPKERMVRMTIDTPEEMHLRLKIKSIQARTSMRDYVLNLIEKDLKKG